MRPSRYFLLLLALTGLSGSRVLSLETAVESAPRAKAARDSHGVHTAAAAALDASGLDASSQQGGGDGRRELDVAARVAARWPKPSGRKQPVATAASDGGEADDASSRGSWGFDRSAGGEGGGDARARGWQSGVRKPRQSETATFFNSLDENSDGVLAENEIREFVGYVGGSSLDDNSEILGGVSTVMGRLDTDSDKGIGLKELSSWINRLGPMLTVEEAADWVSHAVQLPREVAEAFRSNSISAYDFPELVEDNGAGLYDLGIKRKFRKRIVKAIEVRLLGLGDEPPLPVLHPPSYLGGGKADDVASVSGSSSFVFVDSGLSPGKTYVYRVRAWNLIGHSEAPTAHVTTPPVHSLWTKPWRLISPWWPTGNSSAASSSSTASPAASGLQEPEGMGGSSSVARTAGPAEAGFVDRGGLGGTTAEEGGQPSGWGWRDVFGATWSVLSWGGWAVMAVVKVLHAMLALAMLQANLTRLRAAYGHGGTGAAVRRNWAAALVWKLNHLFTSNTVISAVVRSLNEKLERVIGLPPVTPPSAGGQGLRRQNRTRSFRTVGGGGGGGGSETGRRRGRFDSLPAGSGRDDWGGGRGGLSRIDEQDYSGLGVGDYGRRRDSNSSRRWRGGYPPAGDGRSPPSTSGRSSGTHAVVDDEESEPWYCDRSTERSATGTGAASPVNPPPVERKRWFGWGKGVPAEGGSVGEGAIDAGPRAGMPAGEEGDRLRGSGDEVESFDGYGDDAQELSDGGISDGFPWDGDSAEDVGEVEMRPSLERSGSSLDLRRALPHFRSVSVGRLALGLKKGEPSGRDGWRKEFHAAGACFSCRKPFKTITRQRHHCNRCHRVFCAKHGYTAHLKGTVCTIPGGCICDVCLESVVGVEGDGATHEARTTQQRRLFKADSEGGAASVMSTGSEGGGSANGRRFGWGRSTSFGGQLRRRRRAAPSDQSASEKKDDDEGPFSETVTGAEDDGLGGGGGATDRDYDPPPNSARSKAAKRSAVPVSSSETPLRIASVRALTASPSADGSSPAAAAGDGGGRGSAESFSLDPRRVGRGVFGTRRRITR
ncbi:FYVE zinc finger protein [Ectocarpus siliculosus]|uniref:FYVE zinc finger protein n=1 Tax=Ectocarpus siliculosus TaxID=2880 RepID=D8LHW7_ECTSI|nr:FYVE zinc finger protein [Ectocarpus siliculosus]|eukprot:CBN74398.1 FYVE zinc finger protein [Ectocarpus siliculosus]